MNKNLQRQALKSKNRYEIVTKLAKRSLDLVEPTVEVSEIPCGGTNSVGICRPNIPQCVTLRGVWAGACGKFMGTHMVSRDVPRYLATCHAGARRSHRGIPRGLAGTRKTLAYNLREPAVSHGSCRGRSRGCPREHRTCLMVLALEVKY